MTKRSYPRPRERETLTRVDAEDLLRQHTAPRAVPLVPEIRVHTANEITPVWRDVDLVPYWCIPWAGGQALARWVLDNADVVRGRRVLDFGSGSGLVGIAAKLAGAAHVLAADVDPFAKTAAETNAALNGVTLEIVTRDFVGDPVDVDVLLAGDVWYEREPAAGFDAWFRTLAARVVTGDPGRSYVPTDLVELAVYDVPTPLDLEGAASKTTRVLTYPAARARGGGAPRARPIRR